MLEQPEIAFCKFAAKKEIVTLFKSFLMLIEDEVELDNLNPDRFEFLRKRILDKGNESVRQFEEQLDNYIKIQQIKINQTAK